MDIADIANDSVLLQMEQRLAARQPAQGGASAEECADCGDPIPPARRLAMAGRGCVRCIECQGLAERRARG
ncbi:phage/conjugal plasmid C-4 type zinc finger protein, TraR family [compost metagenome]